MSTPLGSNTLETFPPSPMIGAGGSGMPFGMPLNPYLQQQAQQRFRQMAAQSVQRWVMGPNGQPILESFPAQMVQRPMNYMWREMDPTADLKNMHQRIKQAKSDPKAALHAMALGLGFGLAMEALYGNGSVHKPWIQAARMLNHIPVIGWASQALHKRLSQGKSGLLSRTLGYMSPEAYETELIQHDVAQLISHKKIKPHLTSEAIQELKTAKNAKDLAQVAKRLRETLNPKNSAQKVAYSWLNGMHRRYEMGLTNALEHYKDLHQIFHPSGKAPLKPIGRAMVHIGYFLHRLAFGGAFIGHHSPGKMAKNTTGLVKLLKGRLWPFMVATGVGAFLFTGAFKKKGEAATPREGWADFAKEAFGAQMGSYIGLDLGPGLVEATGLLRRIGMGTMTIPLLYPLVRLIPAAIDAPFKVLPIPFVKDAAGGLTKGIRGLIDMAGMGTHRGFANMAVGIATVNVLLETAGDRIADFVFDSTLVRVLFGEKSAKKAPVVETPLSRHSEFFTPASSQPMPSANMPRDPRFQPSIPAAQSLIGQGIFLDPRHDGRLNALSMA